MKRHHLHRLFFTLIAFAAMAVAQPSRASTLFWGSAFNDLLFDAAGQPLGGEFSFEIGSFDGGFIPTMGNINDWAANWKVFDRAFDPTPGDINDGDPEGWDASQQFFTGTVQHTSGGGSDSAHADPLDVFAQGGVVYLWVYNTKDRDTDTEWALVTDGGSSGDIANDWVFPDPTDTSSYDWNLADADSAVIGGLNGTTGGGQAYTIQTSLVPVPEPGSVLLVSLAVMVGLLARHRIKVSTL